MTIFAAAAAGPAAARIRGYSMALWAVGVLAIGAIIGRRSPEVIPPPPGRWSLDAEPVREPHRDFGRSSSMSSFVADGWDGGGGTAKHEGVVIRDAAE